MPHCALDGCGRPCWKGHNYCGKTHARAAGALHDRPARCAFNGCADECFPGHAYCGKTHARAAGALNDDLTVSRGQRASHGLSLSLGKGTTAAGNMNADRLEAAEQRAFEAEQRSANSERTIDELRGDLSSRQARIRELEEDARFVRQLAEQSPPPHDADADCAVCMAVPRTHAWPCGHRVACEQCACEIGRQPQPRCPACREVGRPFRIFL